MCVCLCVHVYACAYTCAQSCMTLWDPMDCSQAPLSMEFFSQNTGVGFHFFLKGFYPPKDRNCISCVLCIGRLILLPLSHLGSPCMYILVSLFGSSPWKIISSDLFEISVSTLRTNFQSLSESWKQELIQWISKHKLFFKGVKHTLLVYSVTVGI